MAAVAVAFAAAGLLVYQWQHGGFAAGPDPVASGQRLLSARLNGLDGNLQSIEQWRGKVLIVNFWATWCAPCVKEMPTLNALQAKLGGDGFQVLRISEDREGAKVAKPFVEKNNWKDFTLFTEAPGKFAKDANLRGLPTSLIIDKNGQIAARMEGELDWNAPEVEKILRDLDLVKREEFEVVKDMARLAREENEALKTRLAALEAKLGGTA